MCDSIDKDQRRQTGDSSSAPALILQSFYRKHGVNVGTQHNTVRLEDLQNAFAGMQPSIVGLRGKFTFKYLAN
jgi:hypothetical protein